MSCAAFLNPEDLDKLWMEAPKTKPVKQHQQPVLSKQGSLEKGNSHEGFVAHVGDSIDDTVAAGNRNPPPPRPLPAFAKEPNCSSGPKLSIYIPYLVPY